MPDCSIRAIWILNQSNNVLFSRRFPTVERRWRLAYQNWCQLLPVDGIASRVMATMPTDAQLVQGLSDRLLREGSIRGRGMRELDSVQGSDSWVDDPITRHIISLQISRMPGSDLPALLWPFILHLKGQFQILVLPLVKPHLIQSYAEICWRSDCGGVAESITENKQWHLLSSMLLELPCITGSFLVAKTFGDVITGETNEPEVVLSSSSTTGGLLDSLTVGIGISHIAARAKPAVIPAASTGAAAMAAAGSAASSLGFSKGSLKTSDKEALRSLISSSMPFGTPLDLGTVNLASVRSNGFSPQDIPPQDLRQPAWKPYLYKGKQRIFLTISELITAALYDRDDVPDTFSLAGQLNCRADLEGLPDVSVPLAFPNETKIESFSTHPCSQAPEHGSGKVSLTFLPPLGNFSLAQYLASSSNVRPPVRGFYQLSMVSEDEGAFLFKLRLMEGYKSPFSMEYCTLSVPFSRRRVLSLDGNPSLGTLLTSDNLIEWKIVISGRPLSKSTEVTFPGTIKFGPVIDSRGSRHRSSMESSVEEYLTETEAVADRKKNEGLFEDQMTKGDANLAAVELEEPFCWEAYSYAKASFKLTGGTVSGLAIDPKQVSVFPAAKVPCDCFAQVVSGDYVFWNSLGRYPHAAPIRD